MTPEAHEPAPTPSPDRPLPVVEALERLRTALDDAGRSLDLVVASATTTDASPRMDRSTVA